MPTLRYSGMPDYLQAAAKRNLAREDTIVSRFNDRVKYLASPVQNQPLVTPDTAAAVTASSSSFSMSLGGPLDTSIGAPVSAFKEPTIASTTNTVNNGDSSNWRFRPFGSSQLPTNGSTAPPLNGAYNEQVSPVATPANPTGAGTPTASSPVVPANYQPKDMTAQKKLYGWGSGSSQEE